MNWDAVGAIAELLGAGGVIATLIYLSLQIRNAANVDRANIRTSLTERSQRAIELTIQHAPIIVKAAADEALTGEERFRVLQLHRFLFRSYENYAYQYSLGLFDESEWRGVEKAIEGVFSERYAQEDWRAVRQQFSGATQEILDPFVPDMIDESKAPRGIYGLNEGESAN